MRTSSAGSLTWRITLRAVLFDLDGTLLDTAPDMVGALNALRREHSLAPLPFESVRSSVSHGAARVVKLGFPDAEPESLADLQRRFLEIYRGASAFRRGSFPAWIKSWTALAQGGIKMRDRHQQAGLAHGSAARGVGAARPLRLRGQRRYAGRAQAASAAAAACGGWRRCRPARASTWATRNAMFRPRTRRPCRRWLPNYGYLRADEDSTAWGGDGYLNQPLDLLDWLEGAADAYERPRKCGWH